MQPWLSFPLRNSWSVCNNDNQCFTQKKCEEIAKNFINGSQMKERGSNTTFWFIIGKYYTNVPMYSRTVTELPWIFTWADGPIQA